MLTSILLAVVSDRNAVLASISLSAIVMAFLVWIIYFKGEVETMDERVSVLPAVNATLNSLSATALLAGWFAIRSGRRKTHIACMITAVVFSALFLISYIIYHNVHGDTSFQGTGIVRRVYFFILISHILCTVVALPLIFTTLFFALSQQFEKHRRIARVTLPLWLYVSVTGVLVFVLLRAHS